MGNAMNDPTSETVRVLERLRAGDRRAPADLFPRDRERDRFTKMLVLQTDARLFGKIDPSDGLPDSFPDLAKPVES
jgi:hypothetical protein